MFDAFRWTPGTATLLRRAYQTVHPDTSNERFAHESGVSQRMLYYWSQRPDGTIRPKMQRALSEFLESSSSEVKAEFARLVESLGDGTSGFSTPPTGRLTQPSSDLREDFAMASQDAILGLSVDCASVSDALAALQDGISAAAGNYSDLVPQAEFEELKRLQKAARAMNPRTQRPADRADLLVITGEATALLASLAFDLGYWDSAGSLAATATAYAETSGHSSLKAWTLGLQATLKFWANQPEVALAYVTQGLEVAPNAASRFKLHNVAARAHAVAGNERGVRSAVQAAELEREHVDDERDPLHHVVAGEFSFGETRADACAAAAWLAVEDGARAEPYLQRTLDYYADRPDHDPVRGPAGGSRIDLASARLLQGDRDGAEEAIRPILAVPSELRTVSLAGRISVVRSHLLSPRWASDPSARGLAEETADWLRTAKQPRGN